MELGLKEAGIRLFEAEGSLGDLLFTLLVLFGRLLVSRFPAVAFSVCDRKGSKIEDGAWSAEKSKGWLHVMRALTL
jgi:hypothetical protein